MQTTISLWLLQEGASISFERIREPIRGVEIAVILAFIIGVGIGVFFLLRRRGEEPPKMRLHD